MDLRTKLVFALVGVSLGSMLALGAAGYSQASGLLRDSALRQLEALAESRADDLENLTDGWLERVQLIASRTQLRLSLADLARADDGEAGAAAARISRIIDDARGSVRSVGFLLVLDETGRVVSSSGAGEPSSLRAARDLIRPDSVPEDPIFVGLDSGADGRPEVTYLAPLRVEDRLVGWLVARIEGDELLAIGRDYTGLGESGETLLVEPTPDGARLLHPARHADIETGALIPSSSLDPASVAAAGRDTTLHERALDYRDEPVWAATRFVPDLGWGVVVKVDALEEMQPIRELRRRMVLLALSLSAFAILVGILLGLHLSRPVEELSEVAARISRGEMSARAPVRAEDEVGRLARTFNRMADTLTAGHLSLPEAADERAERGTGAGPDAPPGSVEGSVEDA